VFPTHLQRGTAMSIMVGEAVLVSFAGLIFRSMEHANIWQISFYRGLVLIGTISLILFLQYHTKIFPHIFRIGAPGFIAGTLMAVAQLCYIESMTHTTIANTVFTMSAIPFITAALARIFLKEKLRRATMFTMAVAALGIYIMISEGLKIGSLYGILMAAAAAFSFSCFAVIVRQHRGINMLPVLLISGLVNSIVGLILLDNNFSISTNDLMLCILWGALIQSLGFYLFILAAQSLVAAELTLFMLLEFSLGPIWVWLGVGETPTLDTLIGGTLVLFSVSLLTFNELRGDASNKTKR
jgi:drug/metabolite transporter (DMT)-like permease